MLSPNSLLNGVCTSDAGDTFTVWVRSYAIFGVDLVIVIALVVK